MLANIANAAEIGGFVFFVIITLIDRWPNMINSGWSLQRVALIALVIALLGWGTSHFLDSPKEKQLDQAVMKTQTTIGFGPDRCAAEIDTSFFMKYRDDYKLALICGVHNPAQDKYEDRRISISQAFTIVDRRIQINVPYTADMIRANQEYVAEHAKSFHPSQGGVNLPLLGSFWNEWILISKSTTVGDIKKLSDVDLYKGKIVSRDIPGA